MELYREIKTGKTWTSLTNDGIWGHAIGYGSAPSGYESVDLEYLDLIHEYILGVTFVDRFQIRQCVDGYISLNSWSGLNDASKWIAINWNSNEVTDSQKVTFLMAEGYSQAEAGLLLKQKWHYNHIVNSVPSCPIRWAYAKYEFMARIHPDDIADFCENNFKLISNYTQNAVEGLEYYDIMNGIMDFVESTNDYSGNGMAENYTLADPTGDSWASLISDVKDIIINAKYTPYNGN